MKEKIKILIELTKIRITSFVTLTAMFGYICYSTKLSISLFASVLGILLLASGSAAINQIQEHKTDSKMKRTMNRPIPSKRISIKQASLAAFVLVLSGSLILLTIGFGYVRKYKGLDLLIEAFPKIKSELPDAKLLIVGEFYDSPDTYLELIAKLNIQKDVVVVNKFVANEQVAKYYKACDLVVLPYRSATQSGILNVAYGFNKPVLVTDVGGLAEFVINKKTGLIVKPNSPSEIANGVIEFFQLSNSVNFEENIKEFVNKNSFRNLSLIFHQIISDANS